VIFQAPLGVGCVVMITPWIVGGACCSAWANGTCEVSGNATVHLSGYVCAATEDRLRNAALRCFESGLQPHHDRVAGRLRP
jgi:hypothetical protein